MFTSRDMSVEDFERKMLASGWTKRRKMAVSPLFHADAPNTYWVKEIIR